jgi:GT2 family glycosyltransferase
MNLSQLVKKKMDNLLEKPLVSVVILNYNGKGFVLNCVSSVLKTHYPNFEIIFVDNASTDDSGSLVERKFGGHQLLKIIKNPRNLGFSEGNNVGLCFAKGTYVAFLNNDTVVDPFWLDYLVEAMQFDKTIGLAQSLLLEMHGNKIQSAGSLLGEDLMTMPPFHIEKGRSASFQFPSSFEVSFANGAAMIIEKELIYKLGLFDPIVPFYYDDTLLSFKVWLAGKRVVTISKSTVFHIGGEATKNLSSRDYFMVSNGLKARICLIFDVFYGLRELFGAFLILFVSSSYDLYYYITKRDFLVVSAYPIVFSWTLRRIASIWKNRINLWSNAHIDHKTLASKFMPIRTMFGIYLLPPGLRRKYFEEAASKYEKRLLALVDRLLKKSKIEIKPKVSIILPTYKRAYLLKHALEALSNQTYQNFEVIVVLKPSGDGSEELLEDYKRLLRLRLITQTGGGVVDAINVGLKQANGEITFFLDDDAICFPNCLQTHVNSYSNPNVSGVAGDVLSATLNKAKVVQLEGFASEIVNYPINPFDTKLGRQVWNCPLKNMEDFFVYISKAGVVQYNSENAPSRDRKIVDSLLGMGANMSVLSEALKGFEFPDFWIRGLSWEQFLGWYLWKKGCRLIFQPEAKVHHIVHGQSLSRNISDTRSDLLRWIEFNMTYYRLYGLEPGLSKMHRISWLAYDSFRNLKTICINHDYPKSAIRLRSKFYSEILGLKWILYRKIGSDYSLQSDLRQIMK